MKNDARIEIIFLDSTDHWEDFSQQAGEKARLKSNRKVSCLIPVWSETAE